MGSAAPEVLQALRAKIRALEAGGAPVQRRRVPSGVAQVDDLLGGVPVPGIVELSGPDGSGRTRIALAIAARSAVDRRAVAWVDSVRRLYPPAVADHGVPLERLLVVRPPDDGAGAWAWATEQLLRSGCFPLVVVDHPGANATASKTPQRALAHGWARAAEHGGSLCLVIATRPVKALPADVRIGVGSGSMVVLRDRAGVPGGQAPVLQWPAQAAPW
jgi:hypothetical protein